MTGFFQSLALTLVASFVHWTGLDSLRGTVTKRKLKNKIKICSEDAKNTLTRRDNMVEWLKYKQIADMFTAQTVSKNWIMTEPPTTWWYE